MAPDSQRSSSVIRGERREGSPLRGEAACKLCSGVGFCAENINTLVPFRLENLTHHQNLYDMN